MPTRQLVCVDDEAPVPVAATAAAGPAVSSDPPQQSSSLAADVDAEASGTSNSNNTTKSSTTEAKTVTETVTVTPKKDGDDESSGKKAKKKAAGRSKKGGNELPSNQRTLGSFFGAAAAGAKKSKPKPKSKSKPKDTFSSKPTEAKATALPNHSSKITDEVNPDADAETAAAPASPIKINTNTKTAESKSKSKPKKKATVGSKSNKIKAAASTAEATSDKIKAIVLGSTRKKAAASATVTSSVDSPSQLLLNGTSTAGIGIATTTSIATSAFCGISSKGHASTSTSCISSAKTMAKSSISTAAIIGIPNGAIPSQKMIQLQEEREEKERAREEQKRLLQQFENNSSTTSSNSVKEGDDDDDGDDGSTSKEANPESSALPPTASFVSPTPPTGKNKATPGDDASEKQQPQQKKAKKRAALISVTTSVADDDAANTNTNTYESTEADADAIQEHPTAMEVDSEQKDGNDDGDVVMIMDDQDNGLTGTAAKGSAVEGTKVLDVTLGANSDEGEGDEADTTSASVSTSAGGAQDVSKKLNFATPNKNKNPPAFGGLDAFAVPISSIKASKKAKAAAAASEAANAEGESYVHKRIAKGFDDGKIYRGTVTKYTAETESDGALWHVIYDDDDEEDLSLEELQAALNLFESEEAKTANAAAPVATTPSASSSPVAAAPTTSAASVTVAVTEQELPVEFKEVLAKHEALRKRYRMRAEGLVQRSKELSEEDFDRTIQPRESTDEEAALPPADGIFPESLLSELAVLVQGSPLPLSTLTNNALAELCKHTEGKNLTTNIVSAKIKISASRKQYLTPLTPPESGVQVDKFEDTQTNLMWRWELTTIELLPADLVKKAKKVVSERRKLQNFFKAIVKLLSSLDKADALFLDAKSLKVKRDSALAKISADEDKVLKFEREEEKQRLIREAKDQKEKAKLEAKAQKDQAKKAAAEKKELEKKAAAEKKELEKKAAAEKKENEKKAAAAIRKEESERKKAEANKAKEEAKRKKEEEKAAKKRKAEAKVEKQRACMASFFGSSSPPRSKTKTSTNNISSPSSTGSSEFDSDAFWKSLGTKGSLMSNPAPFKKLSQQARESRKRKTKEVAVTVFATVMPDNPFDQQPYDEERILRIPNKYKFLAFHEDYRPAYCGTWSKPRSSIVTGRNPLGRDTAFLDYDVDSEAEWEEGDDEEGEDCEIDGPDDDEEEKIDGEEGDTRMYNYDDGWLAQDDEYDVEDNEEDNDEETVAMRKRKAAEAADASKKQGLTLARVCVVAPVFGGIPLVEAGSDILDCPELIAEHVDGADVRAGKELLSSHDAFDFMPCSENCLDLFPAPKSKKSKKTTDKDGSNSSPSKAQASKEMSQDDLRAFAKFVHNSTLGSKDKVIEELQTALPDITSSRAQATRKLDSIAEKRRLKYGGGVVWEVKSSVLESLNLQASDLNPAPVEKEPEKKAAKSPKRKKGDKKEKDPKAPKKACSAYIFWSNANRQKLKEANKEASNADLLKLLGESWKALSTEEKQPYEQMAANDKERYQKEMAAYNPESSEPAEKKAKTIDIQEIWRNMTFRQVEVADLASGKARVLVNHKGSLFKAVVHKSRANGDSCDYQIQYFGNKATTLHWKAFSDVAALLDEKDDPIVVAAAANAEVTEISKANDRAKLAIHNVCTPESTKEVTTSESTAESPVVDAPTAEAKVVADNTRDDGTNAKHRPVLEEPVGFAEGVKVADASSSDKNPTKSSDAAKSGKKRPAPVSVGSKNLLASFLKKKAKKT